MAMLQPPGKLAKYKNRRLSFAYSDLDNPSQLETLFLQCKKQVLDGTHPVSRENAIRLAAVQCFIDYGPYKKGVESFVKAHNLLPKEYARAKEHEKNILHEYKELLCETEKAAKKRYCKLCKSLPTYGVTFFIVKERQSAKERKLVTRLFGVSKDCVMCVDRKSKTVLKSWPLEQLRRWAASPSTFNIDFGDYTDGYYSAQTTQGEVIKKLISEYVDIILKKLQISDSKGIEGDEGGIMLEDHIPAGRALPFMIENGCVSWRQPNQTYGVSNNNDSLSEELSSLCPPVPIHNEQPPPVIRYNLENTAFAPFSPINVPQTKEVSDQYLLQQKVNQINQSRGNINTTITTQKVSYKNNNERPHNPLQWQQNNLLIQNVPQQTQQQQIYRNKVFQFIPPQPLSESYSQQQQQTNASFDKFYQNKFIKIANDIPSSEFSLTNIAKQQTYKQHPLYKNHEEQLRHLKAQNEVLQAQQQALIQAQRHAQLKAQQQAQQQAQQHLRQHEIIHEEQTIHQQNIRNIPIRKEESKPELPPKNGVRRNPSQQFVQQINTSSASYQSSNVARNADIERIASPVQQTQHNLTQTRVVTTYHPTEQSALPHQQITSPNNNKHLHKEVTSQELVETIDSAVESSIQTTEEAQTWLTPESVAEVRELPEMVAAGADAENQLNWLIVMGTHAVSQHLGTFVVAVAQIIESTSTISNQPKSFSLIARMVYSSGVVLSDLIACIRELSALLWTVSEPVASKLLQKTNKLCNIFIVFMEQLHSQTGAKRAAILSAASLVGETTCALLSTTSSEDAENVDDNAQAYYDILNERIQNIASSTANVVLQAKTLPISPEQKGPFFHYATQVAFTASELIALSRVLASVLGTHSTSQQCIAESVQRVANAINEMVVKAGEQLTHNQTAPDQRKKYDQLLSTANFANNALHQFLNEIQQTSLKSKKTV